MMNRKAIAGVLIVTIVVASIAIAVSTESEGGVRGLISAKDIMPGAITKTHLHGEVINDIDIVDPDELADDAIPSITAVNTGITMINETHNVTGNRWDVFNESIGTVERNSKLLITYSARVINMSGVTGDKVVVKCNVLRHYNDNDPTSPLNLTYPAEPTGGVYFAAPDWVNITNTVQFFNASVPPSGTSDVHVNISATTTNATANLTDQVLTVIAIPTA